ncbi:hypothetical protein EI94DRAFT_1743905 [Lactarius quietus]|nr:hypothetical protein EI94DRAFT_1743905 [Lactarius quietus]
MIIKTELRYFNKKIKQQETNTELHAPIHLQTWSEDLKSLVNAFHKKGWVHGDLRDANLIVSDEEPARVMLVDFDWGGNVNDGPVYYPTALVNEELMKPGSPGDLCITKEHDDSVLAFTLDKLAGHKSALKGTDPDFSILYTYFFVSPPSPYLVAVAYCYRKTNPP